MHKFRIAALVAVAVIASSLPAAAQMAGSSPSGSSGLLWVWVVILVVGIIVFVAGTSVIGQPKK
jgi:membrane protein DedA with SNARE-associated domain